MSARTFKLSEEESAKCIVQCKVDSLTSQGILYDFVKGQKLKEEDERNGLQLGHKVWLQKGKELLKNEELEPSFTFRPSKKSKGPKEWFGYARCKLHKEGKPLKISCPLAEFVPGREITFTVASWICEECEKAEVDEDKAQNVAQLTKKHQETSNSAPSTSSASERPTVGQKTPKSSYFMHNSIVVNKGKTELDVIQWNLCLQVLTAIENVKNFFPQEEWIQAIPELADDLKDQIDNICSPYIFAHEVSNIIGSGDNKLEPILSPVPSLEHSYATKIIEETFRSPQTGTDQEIEQPKPSKRPRREARGPLKNQN